MSSENLTDTKIITTAYLGYCQLMQPNMMDKVVNLKAYLDDVEDPETAVILLALRACEKMGKVEQAAKLLDALVCAEETIMNDKLKTDPEFKDTIETILNKEGKTCHQ